MPDLSVLYQHRGTRAVQRMVEFAPSTGGLALWVNHHDLPVDTEAPAVMTDGNTVFYGVEFEVMPLEDQVGLVAHEVLHIALRHPQRFLDLRRQIGDVDLQLFNICADAIVNSTLGHLTWLRLPASSVYLDQLLGRVLQQKLDVEAALLEWDVEKLYRAIDDRPEQQQNGRQQKPGSRSQSGGEASEGGAQGDGAPKSDGTQERPSSRQDGPKSSKVRELGGQTQQDLAPSEEAQGAPEAEAEQAREWSERILRGHAGDGAFSMLRTLIADLAKTRTPWEQMLRTQLARALARKPDISWSRPSRSYIANQGRAGPNRRLPFEPGFSPTKNVPRLAVIVDVSGSIADDLMERFAREIESISRRQEAGSILIIGDDKVRSVTLFEPGKINLRDIAFTGGGGTDFTPLLEEAGKHRPDIAVVLTDLEGPANLRPRFPVIWAVPEAYAAAVQPFGRKLTLS
ncbi:putative metal-dependent peptidase [Rhodopseudomonas rhenobacensis]|uniref:Putative metal-dependent peptidase n=1 Tax=Rhodopseudomonas rhenobacensis TaxID=87461 RepID=A0A7W7Z0A4_9BRAD|nr:VWA-like domain-containing protein [Rhodopseudomonas rhenobacensis]MBB5045611.1 putative metal-dependent peptidase [Rhodopseudomonas rhenobacensis]